MKSLKILLTLLTITGSLSAQSFFKPLAKPVSRFRAVYGDSVTVSPSVAKMVAIRPVFNAVSYTIPDNIAQAGFGISLQLLHYDNGINAYYADFCINALLYGGASLGTPNQGVYAAGASVGFLNNIIAPGVDYNFVYKKPQFTISANINFNNK